MKKRSALASLLAMGILGLSLGCQKKETSTTRKRRAHKRLRHPRGPRRRRRPRRRRPVRRTPRRQRHRSSNPRLQPLRFVSAGREAPPGAFFVRRRNGVFSRRRWERCVAEPRAAARHVRPSRLTSQLERNKRLEIGRRNGHSRSANRDRGAERTRYGNRYHRRSRVSSSRWRRILVPPRAGMTESGSDPVGTSVGFGGEAAAGGRDGAKLMRRLRMLRGDLIAVWSRSPRRVELHRKPEMSWRCPKCQVRNAAIHRSRCGGREDRRRELSGLRDKARSIRFFPRRQLGRTHDGRRRLDLKTRQKTPRRSKGRFAVRWAASSRRALPSHDGNATWPRHGRVFALSTADSESARRRGVSRTSWRNEASSGEGSSRR